MEQQNGFNWDKALEAAQDHVDYHFAARELKAGQVVYSPYIIKPKLITRVARIRDQRGVVQCWLIFSDRTSHYFVPGAAQDDPVWEVLIQDSRGNTYMINRVYPDSGLPETTDDTPFNPGA